MRRGRIPGYQIMITKINVTPIIDVALVLVIILLVTAPMLSIADLPVDLPQARTREAGRFFTSHGRGKMTTYV